MQVLGDPQSATCVTVRLLRLITFLADVEEELLVDLANKARRRTYRPNTALFHEGEPGHVLFMVVSGWVRIEKATLNGSTLVIAKRGPGSQLGELALLDGYSRMADAVTETECDLISLGRDIFLDCISKSPPAALAVMASLAEMVRNSGANLESFRSLDSLGRLAELLLWYADRQGVAATGGGVLISSRLTHQALADQVGVQRETISRSITLMIDRGAIRKEGLRLVVVDPQKLRRMVVV